MTGRSALPTSEISDTAAWMIEASGSRSGVGDPAPTGQWVSHAEVTEIPFTAFASRRTAERVPGRLVVRRIPDLNTEKNNAAGQETLFDTWRFHAFFTTVTAEAMNTVTADKPTAGTRSSNRSTPT